MTAMKKPADRFFRPESATVSMLLLRQWLDRGASVDEIAHWVTQQYYHTGRKDFRMHLGMMLCALYDSVAGSAPEAVARKCAGMFGLKAAKGLSISESAMARMIKTYGTENFRWLADVCEPFAQRALERVKPKPGKKTPDFLYARFLDNFLPIDPTNDIYAMRGIDGNLQMVEICDYNGTLEIDENELFHGAPYYFSDEFAFPSPVWMLNTIEKILDHTFRKVGYPPMKVRKRVVFSGKDVQLLNYESHLSHPAWEGVEVLVANKANGMPLVPPSLPLVRKGASGKAEVKELERMLRMCLLAVSAFMGKFNITERGMPDPSDIDIAYRDLRVFG